ncbi:MAG TPA: thioredoxin family protein [Chthoniobacterales bacterium]|nr:thioredoxin family protein [Chthoniobacterales bacterium]
MKNTKLLLLTFTAICTGTLSAAEAPRVGAPAPGFSLPDSHGKTHSLGELKGKYVVLEWFNPACPFVQKHYASQNMQQLQKQFTGKDGVWLTINSSAEGKDGYLTPAAASKQMADWEMHSTALLLDPDGRVGHEYAATNTPHMYVIDPSGKLIYSGAIDNKPTADRDDIKGATNYVQAALTEAMAGKPVTTPNSRAYGCSIKYAR